MVNPFPNPDTNSCRYQSTAKAEFYINMSDMVIAAMLINL